MNVFFNFPFFFYKNRGEPKIVLLLTPQYLNYGDQAIAITEKRLIKKYAPHRKFLEINYSLYTFFRKRVNFLIGKKDVIVITGGGFIGSLWEESEKLVEDILESFRENRIIVAPQTIYFDEGNEKGIEKLAKLIKSHGKVYIWAREQNTYALLINQMGMLPKKNCGLMPDMVLFMRRKRKGNRKGAGICLRKDHEAILDDNCKLQIENFLKKRQMSVHNISMMRLHVEIPIGVRRLFVEGKLLQFASREIVITDRLHGMIFAALTATPCIVFDNKSKKISGVYESWLKDLSYIRFVNNPREMELTCKELLEADMDWFEQLEQWQKKLQESYLRKCPCREA